MAHRLEDLPIYPRLLDFREAVAALSRRPSFVRNRVLANQIERANFGVLAKITEGFEYPTDRALGNYLYLAKGSIAELLSHLGLAQKQGMLTSEELSDFCRRGHELQRMLGGWIKYLARCNWRDRGRHGIDDRG